MFEPLKYGIPLGFMSAVLFTLQIFFNLTEWTIARWIIGALIIIATTLWLYRKSEQFEYTYRIAWFNGFNVLIASNLVFGILVFILKDIIFDTGDINSTRQLVSIIFTEFVSQMAFGLVVLTGGAFAFKRKNNERRR